MITRIEVEYLDDSGLFFFDSVGNVIERTIQVKLNQFLSNRYTMGNLHTRMLPISF